MTNYIWGNQETQFFFELTPEIILDTISYSEFEATGRLLTLNSMENRVYEIEIDNAKDFGLKNDFIVTKFYRPGRWSREQIKQEHEFLLELDDAEINVIAPIQIDGETLFKLKDHDLFYAVFPKKGGRTPDEMSIEQFEVLGRTLARLHNIGESKKASERITINPHTFAAQNLNFLLDQKMIPAHLENSYKELVESIIELSTPHFETVKNIRIHGDCHAGNIISREDEGIFLIDFDDMLNGPAVQDIWLMTPGRDDYDTRNRNALLDGYEMMRDFNYGELKLVESLRAFRFIHFSAWIAKRWDDPAFKHAFSHFDRPEYWDTQVNDLRDQLILIQEQFSSLDY